MKKLLVVTTLLLFAFTMTFAQTEESTFKKNEISIAPYTANKIYHSLSQPSGGWVRDNRKFNLLESNYRRYLNENTALRFGASFDLGFGSDFSVIQLDTRVGFEKYLTLSPKFQLYGGAELNLGFNGISRDEFRAFYNVGAGLIGGVRYNINEKWSLSSEVIAPVKYSWAPSLANSSGWETGVKWQPLKLNFRF